MRQDLALALALGFGVASFSTQALADVIHEMPMDCPKGTTQHASHNGPYCSPPLRADCPPGYVPQVRRSTSYCEAPPPAPCPKGLSWESTAPDQASCVLNDRCDKVGEACTQGTCQELSFCLEKENMGRYVRDVARGVCRTQSDCAAFPNAKCGKRLTCSDPQSRKQEAARIAAAKNVPPSAVPAPYVAGPFGGGPPRYRILKDGQALPALPDVPEPPDDTPPTTSPPAEDAGAATAPPDTAPGDVQPVDVNPEAPPETHPTPPTSGGCAGCTVDSSDRGMAGLAALMSMLGLGIALRRKGGRR